MNARERYELEQESIREAKSTARMLGCAILSAMFFCAFIALALGLLYKFGVFA
jgi:hypothetical protein